ncbi:hypothetical protein GLOTRDRAFT_123647 [Gloeophyllum trabeum ATCC 11539]|uniref:Transmembrane protein n=1 Tax=Gloeophyllum trabeum (strain ATCC 11539 / FP-39264 / Madison 617) TaxID=670483 RepID=S7RCP2_GLOTA|nr:uncharacterized protein GLOTRDRAFT_123647 [Gloeophyllum trabeum ATCC 11539]EPQ50164.1 hypothetical protein GLOTRDRAFT_123647 [Gloeophyllum trabeum ATCC 11539]
MNGGLPVSLLALVCAMLPAPANAEADDQEECEQVRQLNNDQGYTPCEVARQLIAPCYPQLDSSQTFNARGWLSAHANSTCSCNSVVYNLLNACELCRDEGPMGFSDWTSKCGPHNVTITNYYPIANAAVHIPAWAYTDIASDKFNEQEVRDNKWTPIQIATPVIAGLAVLLLCGAAFWWYRARHCPPAQHRTTYPPKRWCLSDLLRRGPSPVVHSRLHSWADTDAERPQHPSRLSSYSDGESVRGIDHKPFLGKIFAGKGPVPLHSLPRRQGFRIDDTDVSTKAASRSSTVVIGAHAGADEQSVLLISRTPGVDFSIESTTVHSPRTERTAHSPRTERTVHSPRTERTVHSPRTERTEGGMTGVSLDVEPPSPLSPGLPNVSPFHCTVQHTS